MCGRSELEAQIGRVKAELEASQRQEAALTGELEEAKAAAAQLEAKVADLRGALGEAEAALAAEAQSGALAAAEAEALRGQVAALQGDLSAASDKLQAERVRPPPPLLPIHPPYRLDVMPTPLPIHIALCQGEGAARSRTHIAATSFGFTTVRGAVILNCFALLRQYTREHMWHVSPIGGCDRWWGAWR